MEYVHLADGCMMPDTGGLGSMSVNRLGGKDGRLGTSNVFNDLAITSGRPGGLFGRRRHSFPNHCVNRCSSIQAVDLR